MNRSLLLILCLVPCLSNAGGTSWTVPDSSLELALGYRFNFFPSSLLESVFSETMPIRAHGVGLELLSKKQSFLLFLNVQHDFSAIKDGVWVDFEGESKHSEIDLSMTSAEFGLGFDIALPGTPVSLTLGGGIGIGVLSGSLHLVSTDPEIIYDEYKPIPPILPILHLFIAPKFTIAHCAALRVEFGFRDLFYVGLSGALVLPR
ncbi:MAG: hypothetical protein A2284_18085 [Deltaproteobacteria bacterium RIFOXYA12_FULL_61_11]|nr:MAG: hypothetical protein A2284_18085 [Deltaproteobacteria bacterium RIFOXYA12_FULL_61_11]